MVSGAIARNLAGKTFGRLSVLDRAPNNSHAKVIWRCRCECGNIAFVISSALSTGRTRSCGCLAVETVRKRSLKHGNSCRRKVTREYRAWLHAKERCLNPNVINYQDYGGRGITMCDRWKDSFAAFLLDMGLCPPKLTLDRINVNGNYEPNNCRWTDMEVQARNRRNGVTILYQQKEWSITSLFARIKKDRHSLLEFRKKYPEASFLEALHSTTRIPINELSIL